MTRCGRRWFTAASRSRRKTKPKRARLSPGTEPDPGLADAYLNLGRIVHEGGDTQQALRLYREAVRRIPDDPVAHYNLATALEDTRDLRAAAKHYHIAVEIDPEFADAHFNLAQLLERLGQGKRALRHLMTYRRLTEH
jgi:tetratricopeptide (TPR) repeat protein